MSTDDEIEAILRRGAEEEARCEAERRQEELKKECWRRLGDLFQELEQFWATSMRVAASRGEPKLTPEEEIAHYADLLIRLCRGARDAGLATAPPQADSPGDGPLLAAEILRLAFAEDADGITRILGRLENRQGSQMVEALFRLLRHGVLQVPVSVTSAEPSDQAGSSHDRAEAGRADERKRKVGEKIDDQLKPSREKAYRLFQWATGQKPDLTRDRDVYDWLQEHSDVLEELPRFDTWSKYLREARAHYQDHKHTPRSTKTPSGKSVVRRDQI
jgi:hypothetical protein